MKLILNDLKIISVQSILKLTASANKILKVERPQMHSLAQSRLLNINFVSDSEIQALNKQYRGLSKPTDVLSWGFLGNPKTPLLENEVAGEIYISLKTAKEKAKKKRIPLESEILYLITHGLLHIFEFDHSNDEDEAEMDRITALIIGN